MKGSEFVYIAPIIVHYNNENMTKLYELKRWRKKIWILLWTKQVYLH